MEILTVSPRGLTKSRLEQIPDTLNWKVTASWTPDYSQIGPHIFCFSAIDNLGYVTTIFLPPNLAQAEFCFTNYILSTCFTQLFIRAEMYNIECTWSVTSISIAAMVQAPVSMYFLQLNVSKNV